VRPEGSCRPASGMQNFASLPVTTLHQLLLLLQQRAPPTALSFEAICCKLCHKQHCYAFICLPNCQSTCSCVLSCRCTALNTLHHRQRTSLTASTGDSQANVPAPCSHLAALLYAYHSGSSQPQSTPKECKGSEAARHFAAKSAVASDPWTGEMQVLT